MNDQILKLEKFEGEIEIIEKKPNVATYTSRSYRYGSLYNVFLVKYDNLARVFGSRFRVRMRYKYYNLYNVKHTQ